MRIHLNDMFNENINDLRILVKARLWEARCAGKWDADEMLNECFLYLNDLIGDDMTKLDYLKMAKRWITNQTGWQASPGQPRETHKNFKTKHKTIGFDISIDNRNFVVDTDFDDNVDFAVWVEKKLDRPEKTLFRMYFIDGQSHRKIADTIRKSGIDISDTSVYLEIKKLKTKLKKMAIIWSKL